MGRILEVEALWDGSPARPGEIAKVAIEADGNSWRVAVEARYYGDPPPPGPAASTEGLWEYEVVELFVAARASLAHRPTYTEIELSPHGHYLVLRFEGVRQRVGVVQPLAVETRIEGDRWRASMQLTIASLPARPWTANGFAVHGVGPERRFLAATPVPGSAPDFHQPATFPEWVVQSTL